MVDKLINAESLETDIKIQSGNTNRPNSLKNFIGQETIKNNLSIFIESSKIQHKPLDHVLLYGPPGLGKSSVGYIIAKELNVNIQITSGPLLTKAGDLAAILTNINEKDVIFIDEIHRLNIAVEELLYAAMEDFVLDIMIGEGPGAKSVRIDIPKFTLVGATTRVGLISKPLRDRFGIPLKLEFYTINELKIILRNISSKLDMSNDDISLEYIAKRSRSTPRVAIRLLYRVRDFAITQNNGIIDKAITTIALNSLEIDIMGLDLDDLRYLKFIAQNNKKAIGIETIAAALSERKNNIEETIEPYLIKIGFVQKTNKGRELTDLAYDYLIKQKYIFKS